MPKSTTPKPLRIEGEVPDDYSGPVYYRIAENMFAPVGRKFRAETKDEAWNALSDSRNHHLLYARPGILLDAEGVLLPRWRVPQKMRLLTDKQLPYEFYPGSWMTERVHDAIEAIEPDRHLFIPIDATRPDGQVERHYFMKWGDAFLPERPPTLDPAKNGLEPVTYIGGSTGYSKPAWTQYEKDEVHFGYLNADAIGDRHLFACNLLDNQAVLSEALIDALRPFGDVFSKFHILCPIGVA